MRAQHGLLKKNNNTGLELLKFQKVCSLTPNFKLETSNIPITKKVPKICQGNSTNLNSLVKQRVVP